MIEKNQVEMSDLFSLIKMKKPNADNFSREEREAFVHRYENDIEKTLQKIEMNEYKKEVVEKAKELNYDKNNVKKSVLGWIMAFDIVVSILVILFLSLIIVMNISLPFHLTYGYNGEAMGDNLWLQMGHIFATSVFVFLLIDLKKNNLGMKSFVLNSVEKMEGIMNGIILKCFMKYPDTVTYYKSKADEAIFKENKSDDELYNKFLLKEIENDKNISRMLRESVSDIYSKKIAKRATEEYEKYLMKEKDLRMIKRYIR